MTTENKYPVSCSFCGYRQDERMFMIAGPNSIYICDECIQLCSDIVFSEMRKKDKEKIDIDTIFSEFWESAH